MANCGIPRIDQLLDSTAGVSPIGPEEADKRSVSAIQDLLTGHGASGLPGLLAPSYGIFGPVTAKAVRQFRAQHHLPEAELVDTAMLRSLVQTPASTPVLSRAYLTLVLDLPYTRLARILCLVCQVEGAGRFAAMNLNTDGAGLSFGLIQWAQKPGRLAGLLAAWAASGSGLFAEILAGGDEKLAALLLAHTRKPNGGVDAKNGGTTDPAFDLIRDPWIGRFRRAALSTPFQTVQVECALAGFRQAYERLCRFAPDLQSEQSVAFMIDLANQFGDDGARRIYRAARRSGMSEPELRSAIAAESVRRIPDEFKTATDARRQCFLSSDFFSDSPFAGPGSGDVLA